MPTPITGTNTWTDPVPGITNGDPVDASTDNPALQALANRDVWLKSRVLSAGGGIIPIPLGAALMNNGGFNPYDNPPVSGWRQEAAATIYRVRWVIPPLISGRLVRVYVTVDGNGGGTNHAGFPANLPTVQVTHVNLATGVTATGAAVVDPSANLAAYELLHEFSVPVVPDWFFTSTTLTYLDFYGEHGANALANTLLLLGARMEVAGV